MMHSFDMKRQFPVSALVAFVCCAAGMVYGFPALERSGTGTSHSEQSLFSHYSDAAGPSGVSEERATREEAVAAEAGGWPLSQEEAAGRMGLNELFYSPQRLPGTMDLWQAGAVGRKGAGPMLLDDGVARQQPGLAAEAVSYSGGAIAELGHFEPGAGRSGATGESDGGAIPEGMALGLLAAVGIGVVLVRRWLARRTSARASLSGM